MTEWIDYDRFVVLSYRSDYSTSAMSLLYECINTVIAVLISVSANTPGDQTASIQVGVWEGSTGLL